MQNATQLIGQPIDATIDQPQQIKHAPQVHPKRIVPAPPPRPARAPPAKENLNAAPPSKPAPFQLMQARAATIGEPAPQATIDEPSVAKVQQHLLVQDPAYSDVRDRIHAKDGQPVPNPAQLPTIDSVPADATPGMHAGSSSGHAVVDQVAAVSSDSGQAVAARGSDGNCNPWGYFNSTPDVGRYGSRHSTGWHGKGQDWPWNGGWSWTGGDQAWGWYGNQDWGNQDWYAGQGGYGKGNYDDWGKGGDRGKGNNWGWKGGEGDWAGRPDNRPDDRVDQRHAQEMAATDMANGRRRSMQHGTAWRHACSDAPLGELWVADLDRMGVDETAQRELFGLSHQGASGRSLACGLIAKLVRDNTGRVRVNYRTGISAYVHTNVANARQSMLRQ